MIVTAAVVVVMLGIIVSNKLTNSILVVIYFRNLKKSGNRRRMLGPPETGLLGRLPSQFIICLFKFDKMVNSTLSDKLEALTDLETAVLLCIVAREHCIIDTERNAIEDLEDELILVCDEP